MEILSIYDDSSRCYNRKTKSILLKKAPLRILDDCDALCVIYTMLSENIKYH